MEADAGVKGQGVPDIHTGCFIYVQTLVGDGLTQNGARHEKVTPRVTREKFDCLRIHVVCMKMGAEYPVNFFKSSRIYRNRHHSFVGEFLVLIFLSQGVGKIWVNQK